MLSLNRVHPIHQHESDGQLPSAENRQGLLPTSRRTTERFLPSRAMERIYREIGLAVVANALKIGTNDLDPEVGEAIRRGARYVLIMLVSARLRDFNRKQMSS
jgi:hypothetical protein